MWRGRLFYLEKKRKKYPWIIFQDFLRPPLIVELYIYNASKGKRLSKTKALLLFFLFVLPLFLFGVKPSALSVGCRPPSLGELPPLSRRVPTIITTIIRSSSSSWSFNTKQWLLFWQRPDTDQTQLRWLLTRYDKICESRYMKIYSKKWSEHDSLYGNDQHHHYHRHYDHNHHHHPCKNAISQNNIWLNNQFFSLSHHHHHVIQDPPLYL